MQEKFVYRKNILLKFIKSHSVKSTGDAIVNFIILSPKTTKFRVLVITSFQATNNIKTSSVNLYFESVYHLLS